jgi:hypothetical protein
MRAITLTFSHPSIENHPDEIGIGPFETGVVTELNDNLMELKVVSSGHVIARQSVFGLGWLIPQGTSFYLPNGELGTVDGEFGAGYAYEQLFIQPASGGAS